MTEKRVSKREYKEMVQEAARSGDEKVHALHQTLCFRPAAQ
jgi:hypothetical protein